jgi:hypothetical protein
MFLHEKLVLHPSTIQPTSLVPSLATTPATFSTSKKSKTTTQFNSKFKSQNTKTKKQIATQAIQSHLVVHRHRLTPLHPIVEAERPRSTLRKTNAGQRFASLAFV